MWWARFAAPHKLRPVVLVSREEAYARRRYVVVAAVTTKVRQIPAEVALGTTEGLPRECVANCDDLRTISRSMLVKRAGALAEGRLRALDTALMFTLGLD